MNQIENSLTTLRKLAGQAKFLSYYIRLMYLFQIFKSTLKKPISQFISRVNWKVIIEGLVLSCDLVAGIYSLVSAMWHLGEDTKTLREECRDLLDGLDCARFSLSSKFGNSSSSMPCNDWLTRECSSKNKIWWWHDGMIVMEGSAWSLSTDKRKVEK